VIAFLAVAVIGSGALVVSAAAPGEVTAFSLRLPANVLLPFLYPGKVACQKPIYASQSFRGIRVWLWPGYPPGARLSLRVLEPRSGTALATAETFHQNSKPAQFFASPMPSTFALNHVIAAGIRFGVCIDNQGPAVVNLLGSKADSSTGEVSVDGQRAGQAVSLLFLRPRHESLLSLLPTVFHRASLFRPGWIGAWTFWLLVGLLIAAFAVAAWGVARADG
jgi:hypothetical protein